MVAVEDAISTQGKTGDETREGLARLANLVIADYGQLIGRLTPAEDLSQGLEELLRPLEGGNCRKDPSPARKEE